MNKRYHLIFSGTVQGVGFRYTARALAAKYHLNGWVKNLPDEKVELEIEGSPQNLDIFLKEINEEFKGYIRNTELEDLPSLGIYDDFQIRMY
jgi:acylphosphatase